MGEHAYSTLGMQGRLQVPLQRLMALEMHSFPLVTDSLQAGKTLLPGGQSMETQTQNFPSIERENCRSLPLIPWHFDTLQAVVLHMCKHEGHGFVSYLGR